MAAAELVTVALKEHQPLWLARLLIEIARTPIGQDLIFRAM
jgi:hypothetical protein